MQEKKVNTGSKKKVSEENWRGEKRKNKKTPKTINFKVCRTKILGSHILRVDASKPVKKIWGARIQRNWKKRRPRQL